MKKIIVSISGVLMIAFMVAFTANASTGDPKDPKKAQTEASKDCAGSSVTTVSAEKAEATGCDKSATAEAKPCGEAAKSDCSGKTAEKKCDDGKNVTASKK